jgi:hypothetical protein
VLADFGGISGGPVDIDAHIAADGPAKLRERLKKRSHSRLKRCIICCRGNDHADAPDPLALLGQRCQWPRYRYAAQTSKKLPAPHIRTLAQIVAIQWSTLIRREASIIPFLCLIYFVCFGSKRK